LWELFYTRNESFEGLVNFSYWDFIAQSEIEGERYEFSKVHLLMEERNHYIWKYFQEFLYNYGYCEEITKFGEFNDFDYV